jgi:hypothetical protein
MDTDERRATKQGCGCVLQLFVFALVIGGCAGFLLGGAIYGALRLAIDAGYIHV